MALAFGLAVVGCDTTTGGGGEATSNSGNGGITVVAQGIQVKEGNNKGEIVSDVSTFTGDFGYCNWGTTTGPNPSYHADPITQYTSDSSIEVTNGKLTMTLGVPKAEYLSAMTNSGVPTGITISPSGAKSFLYYRGFCTFDVKQLLICMKIGNTEVSLLFVDRDVNINGTYTHTESGTTYTVHYKCSYKKGWNYMIGEGSGSGGSLEIKYTSSQTLPTGFNWVIVPGSTG